jgi:hypothetical protein
MEIVTRVGKGLVSRQINVAMPPADAKSAAT